MPKAVGDRGPEHRAVRVARLLAEDDQVRALALEHGGEGARGGDEIGAGRGLVGHEHRAVRPHGQRLAERVEGARWPERDEDDLPVSLRLLDAQRLLDRLCVELIQRPLARAVQSPGSGVDALMDSRIGDFLDTDRDLHGQGL